MNLINTRFSDERRVKLILLCIVFAVISSLSIFTAASYLPEEIPPGSINLVRTSESGSDYSVFETSHDTISARGKYTDSRVRRLYLDNSDANVSGSYSIKVHEDGSYEAEISRVPDTDGSHYLYVTLDSGAQMKYIIYYTGEKGWFFPVNGFESSNRRVFDHIFDDPREAAALYLSPTQDPDEINATLEQIKLLADEVTDGLTDDYEKARAISRFISGKIYYDHDAKETNVDLSTIALSSVLKKSRTTCAGFANLFCAMAEAVGIDAVNIKGGISNYDDIPYTALADGRQNHEWAAFFWEKENRWVWADACWDGSGNYIGGKYHDGKPKYMYFDISDMAFSFNHRADKAERRHYFEAKSETRIIGEDNDAVPEATADSGETDAEQTSPADGGADIPETTAAKAEAPGNNNSNNTDTDEQIPVSYTAAIAALSAAVILAAVILIRILIKGRKN